MKQRFILVHQEARSRALSAINSAPDGYVVEVKPKTRSLEQNAHLWALLTDISNQANWHGMKLSQDEWKDLFSAGLVKAKVVPNMEGSGFVILGQRTSKLSKRDFCDLIDLILAFAVERGVKLSSRYGEAA